MFMSALQIAAHCQHACERFDLKVQLLCSDAYKTLPANQY